MEIKTERLVSGVFKLFELKPKVFAGGINQTSLPNFTGKKFLLFTKF